VLLAAIVEERADTSILSIDATHLKVHQDACRHPSLPEKQALGKTKGGRNTKLNASVDAAGKLVDLLLIPGNEHEVKSAADLLGENLKGAIILADKGYQSSELAAHILAAGGFPNIPSRERTTTLRQRTRKIEENGREFLLQDQA